MSRWLSGSAKICRTRSAECPHLAISAWPVTTLSQSWNVKALAVLQREHRVLAHPPTLQPGAPLFAIRECLLLAVLAQWLCGRFWTHSRASGAGRGLFPTTHVAAIKRRKGPCSRGPLLLPALSEIPQSRCYSNWTHFQCLKEGRKGGGILPVATLHPLFKWWIMKLNIFLSVHFSAHWHKLDCTLWNFFQLLSPFSHMNSLNLIFIKTIAKGVT